LFKKSSGGAHVEEEILMIKNCKDSLKKLGWLALYRDFKTLLMAIFGHGGHRNTGPSLWWPNHVQT